MKKYVILILFLCLAFPAFSQTITINEVQSSNLTGIEDEDGDQTDWIELYNNTGSAVNLAGFSISDDAAELTKWVFPSVSIASHGFLLLYASDKDRNIAGSNLHTNFKLAKEGDTLYVSNGSGTVIEQFITGEIPADISRGRKTDGTANIFYFSEPTPGESNSSTGFTSFARDPVFSSPGGFYSSALSLTLTASSGEDIYYTLDGTEPTTASTLYSSPIPVSDVTTVRAKSFGTGLIPSKGVTYTYFVNSSHQLPVISITTNPDYLWDADSGIYVLGDTYEPDFPYEGANFWEEKEIPIHIEMYEPAGELAFSIDAGAQIFGGWSRAFDQKSLAIYARDRYGYSEIEYKIFPNLDLDKFKSIVLRNGGQDWQATMMRDELMTSLVEETELDIQAFRPSVVYINGEYWGIHNIREKLNEDYLADHHDVKASEVDMLKLDYEVEEGSNEHYLAMLDYLESNDLTVAANYAYIKTQMDVDNFIKYCVTEIYVGNGDWPGSNIEYWRPQAADGKWRWILYDTDFGFGLYEDDAYTDNTLAQATEENGPEWPNPAWSTFLLRRLLTNSEFKTDFINTFAEYSNTLFSADSVIKKIDYIKAAIEPEIEAHQIRWGKTLADWQDDIEILYNYANNRLLYARLHYMQEFNLSGLANITTYVSNFAGGSIEISGYKIPSYPWTGIYFKDVPIKFTANAKNGYHFTKWQGVEDSLSQEITLTLTESTSLTAVFEPDSGIAGNLIINEINYHSADDFDTGDWVELYNTGQNTLELTSWVFRDEDDSHEYFIPHNTFIEPGKYLVLCENDSAFHALFPDVTNYVGDLDFGFSNNSELLRLYDPQMNLVDALTYNDEAPWPAEADGDGPTLSLLDPSFDNSLPESWGFSRNHGTPGAQNDFGTDVETNPIPTTFALNQNYPNPFNPSTTISFAIPEAGHVTLKVFDILGNEVRTLMNEYKSIGYYNVNFNASDLSSGVYVYQIQVNNETARKKLVLLK